MKKCTKCLEEKPFDKFSRRNQGKSYQSWCKACAVIRNREDYAKDPSKQQRRIKQYLPAIKERNKAFILEYLKANPCVDCGETDIEVLEFDHIEPLRARGGRVTSFVMSSIEKVQSEIDKCQVRCSNCHTRRTRRQFGWSRI